jgi:putative endonuclease
MSLWSLYLVRCADSSLYTGIATDVSQRFAQHCQGGPRGAKYLRGRGPLQLVFCVEVGDRSQASKLELRVKRLSKMHKERLLEEGLAVLDAPARRIAGDCQVPPRRSF